MGKPLDITGQRFGRLIAVLLDRRDRSHSWWICFCDCGGKTVQTLNNLRRGLVHSCGCYRRDFCTEKATTHGMIQSTEYGIWSAMKRRCSNKNTAEWKNYGGRGIRVCRPWLKFENFYADMGPRPPGLTLDRIDNDSGYEPKNCRWATRIEQANNTRNTCLVVLDGEGMSLSRACKRSGLRKSTVYSRIRRGWPKQRWFAPLMR